MKFFPFETFFIETNLKQEEVVELLKKNTTPSYFSIDECSKSFYGVVTNNSFELRRIMFYRNSFRPIINGEIISSFGQKTNVEVSFTLQIVVKIFLGVWFGVLGFFASLSIFAFFSFPNQPAYAPFVMILFIGLFGAFAYLICWLGFKYEVSKSKQILSELLIAK